MEVKLGDFFYLYRKDGKTMHKINYLENNIFEWGKIYKTPFGWGETKDLKPNPDNKSKVRWIKEED